MILESAIANLTSNLDIICQQDGKGISSHEKLKEKALYCLVNLLKNAPKLEYTNLIKSDDSEILLGYLLSILCRLAKDDKSKSIRLLSLDTIEILIDQLGLFHTRTGSPNDRCSILPIVLALPGVSSVLFKLIISDTKLPTNLIVKSVRVLGKLIVTAFSTCDHNVKTSTKGDLAPRLVGDNLVETCDNLSIRLSFMLKYITSNSGALRDDVIYETLDTCYNILKGTPTELVSKSLKSILRYMAFMSSNLDKFVKLTTEIQLKLMLMTDEFRFKLSNEHEQLDMVVLTCLFEIMDNLETNSLTMLIGERQSELEMLRGLMNLLPQETMTTLLEAPERKDQLMTILVNLTEFSTQQPLLFLTESRINENAVQQLNDNRVYTIEKRFAHLNEKEIQIINACCHMIGQNTKWPLLMDIFRNDLALFSSPNNLYVTLQTIIGCSSRQDLLSINICRFTCQTIQRYQEVVCERLAKQPHTVENQIYSSEIMIVVIMIETIVALIELHLKSVKEPSQAIIILKDLLCPLLSWCSSSSRAISEASLSALTQISHLYKLDSTKSLIEQNTDYIIDGITKMLNNFSCYPEVTNVLAITFKLSSIQTFYYFKDVYERVFKVLAKYHQTRSSVQLTLLLYRTVSILNDWRSALRSSTNNEHDHDDVPLKNYSSNKAVIHELDINRIIKKLRDKSKEVERINENMENMEATGESEAAVAKQIESGQIDAENNDEGQPSDSVDSSDNKTDRRDDIVILTERILKHCVGLMSSNHNETKILALKTAARGFEILQDDENTLLPLVHQIWSPLMSRLNQNYIDHLEENLCAFECLVSMARHSKDFIKRRALDTIIPKICIFLESQASSSRGKREYEPYCMTMQYKCQVKILSHLGQLAYFTQIAYTSLWRIVNVALKYLDASQVPSLYEAALATLNYLIALDADCVWFFAKQNGKLDELQALKLVFELP
uniref:TELO2-interacting protein 1 n=1 Tax=Aceria tosichella TaxID=561515 RepID=A0A6G1S4A8_9ACAR